MNEFTNVPHPHLALRRRGRPPRVADEYVGFNGRLAAAMTKRISSMWSVYLTGAFVGGWILLAKEGAAYGYTRELGYHPLLASRAGTDETLHVRLRKGSANTQRGAERFVDELIARVRRAGATGEILLRADSGFWNKKITAGLRKKGCLYSIGVRVATAIEAIPKQAWQPLADYPDTGEAQIAETVLATSG